MKIIYISKSIIPSRSANSVHVMKMCQAFARNGHEVVLLAPDFKEQYEDNIQDEFQFYNIERNFNLLKLKVPKVKGRTFLYAFRVWIYLMKNNSDLVYGRFLLGCYISTLLGKDTVFESHAPIYNENKLSRLIFGKIVKSKHFKKLVVISQKLKEIYIKKDIKKDSVIVAHDGADEVKNLRNKIDLRGDFELNIGYIGHLYKGKGMEVIENIVSKLPEFAFHIVGGTENDIKYWKSKIKSDNIFFYGFVNQSLVQQYINSMDICLLPNQKIVSTYGNSKNNISQFTSPLKMFEYMASRKSIIASDLPVLKEVLNEKNALLVGCDNYQQWIDAIYKLQDNKLREKIAQAGYTDFINNFSWKQRASNILKEIS